MRGKTIQDVAKAAEVSPTSVSNYLNGRHAEMAVATRARIASAIATLGYVPNSAARQLKTGHSRMLGLLVPSVLNPYAAELAVAVEAAAQKNGFQVMLCNTQRDPQQELVFMRELVAQGVRGIISAIVLRENLDAITEFVRQGVAFVVFENIGDDKRLEQVDLVTVDHAKATASAVDYLTGLGHTVIAYVTPTPLTPHRLERLQGFRGAMQRHGLGDGLVITNDTVPAHARPYNEADLSEFGRWAADQIADADTLPTAVIAMNDMVAFGLLSRFYELRFQIPADISLVGIDGIHLTSFVSPALTTIRQPFDKIAECALDCLIARMDRPDLQKKTIVLDPELMKKASTASPPAR